MVEFDTIAPALDGESQLYDKLALLMDRHAELLRTLKDDVAQQRRIRHNDALRLIAELLVDVAACRLVSPPDDASLQSTTQTLRQQVRDREQACVQSLLARYNFDSRHFSRHRLPLQGERWGMDLFHPQALKDVGIRVTKGMAAGAMAGATMDVFMAGISLGTATLVGAAAGGLWQGAERLGKRLVGRLRGYQELTVDDAVLRLLALRQLALVEALEQRGHAARKPLELGEISLESPTEQDAWRSKPLPDELAEARSRPEWSILSADYTAGPRRDELVRALAGKLDSRVTAGRAR
jgi:hypothetical protein